MSASAWRGFAALALAALVAGGCSSDPARGYANVSPHDRGLGSISIPVFENTTHHGGLETMLTKSLMRRVQRETPWRLEAGAGADTRLEGTIVSVKLERLGVDRVTGLGNEMAVDMGVDFRWVDNRTGRPIVARRNFRAAATFVPAEGVREPIELGLQGAAESLAESILAELRADW